MAEAAGGITRWVRPVWAVVAVAVVGLVTWVMWSDWPARSSAVESDLPFVPASIEEPVRNWRSSWGDADAHVVLWFVAAVVVALAVRERRDRRWALLGLIVWSIVVELLQPYFTELRALQFADAAAGVVGIAIVMAVGEWRARRNPKIY